MKARIAAVLAVTAALVALPVAAASAHPLGNFTVNRYDGLVASDARLTVDHVEDLAEIPAAQAKADIDTDEDNTLAPAELRTWADSRCADAARGARLTVGGEREQLGVGSAKASLRPGQAGLPTLRVQCRLTAALPRGDAATITYRPKDIGTGPGWREITARGDRRTLTRSDVARRSISQRLTSYPKDLLSSPSNERSAALRTTPGGPALADSSSTGTPVASSVLPRGADRWTTALTGLVSRHDLTPGFAALAFGAALLLGAIHALAPGHGKTLMAAAAAAGGRTSRRDMFALGASVTVTHTMGVFVLGLLVTAGSAAAPSVIGWLGVASGLLVTFAGAALLRRAWRLRGQEHGHSHSHDHDHGHDHGHGHGQGHGDGHGHGHGHDDHGHAQGHGHDHDPAQAAGLASVPAVTAVLTAERPAPRPHHHHHHPTPSSPCAARSCSASPEAWSPARRRSSSWWARRPWARRGSASCWCSRTAWGSR